MRGNRFTTWQALHDQIMQCRDPGPLNAAANAVYGVDRRDPTSDRRALAFCLSLSEDRYLRNGRCKDVFRRQPSVSGGAGVGGGHCRAPRTIFRPYADR